MPQFAANLSWLYAELPASARFEAAARDGFKAVELLSPYAWPERELVAMLKANDLQLVLMNAPPGGRDVASIAAAWEAGAKGTACLPAAQGEFRAGLALALDYAEAVQCKQVHVMAGIAPEGLERSALDQTYLENLRYASAQALPRGVDILIEPINTRDIPRFFLNRQYHAHALVEAVGAPNLKVQMDLYHCQVVEGDVATKLGQYLPGGKVGHLQIAGVPARQEPDAGELNYAYLFDIIDALGFSGWVGCEYRPALGAAPGATTAGLGWLRALGGPMRAASLGGQNLRLKP